eukprot:scaffold120647_cov63-Phaeocystis_antarctica.AAC.1
MKLRPDGRILSRSTKTEPEEPSATPQWRSCCQAPAARPDGRAALPAGARWTPRRTVASSSKESVVA